MKCKCGNEELSFSDNCKTVEGVIHSREDCTPEEPDAPAIPFYAVAIVMYDKAYGGPEEGGWYYATFEPVQEYAFLTKIVKTDKESREACAFLRKYIDDHKLNEGRRSVDSVLSEGEYTVHVYEGEYPCFHPKTRPHYE